MGRRSSSRRKKKAEKPSGSDRRVIATNRKARYDYHLLAKVEAGLVLLGSEVKSLRQSGATIRESFARMEGAELWLVGMHIPPLPQASYLNHEPLRRRKCLLHRRELRKIQEALEAKGQTCVPLSLYFKGHRVKVELALARGRSRGDRRQTEREKEDRRSIKEYS